MHETRIMGLMGGHHTLKREIRNEIDFVDAINEGIPKPAVAYLQSYIGLNDSDMANMIHLSPKTFRSRKVYKGDEGDHVYTIARIIAIAEETIGTKEAAIEWLYAPQSALGGRIPFHLIGNSAGVQAVEDILGRIEYGVYS